LSTAARQAVVLPSLSAARPVIDLEPIHVCHKVMTAAPPTVAMLIAMAESTFDQGHFPDQFFSMFLTTWASGDA